MDKARRLFASDHLDNSTLDTHTHPISLCAQEVVVRRTKTDQRWVQTPINHLSTHTHTRHLTCNRLQTLIRCIQSSLFFQLLQFSAQFHTASWTRGATSRVRQHISTDRSNKLCRPWQCLPFFSTDTTPETDVIENRLIKTNARSKKRIKNITKLIARLTIDKN